MAARRFNLFDDSFTSGYTRVGPSRGRSRADQVHHGRSSIDRRRHHSLTLESVRGDFAESLNELERKNQAGGSSQQRRDTFATQAKTASGHQENSGFWGNPSGRGVHFSENEVHRNFVQDQPQKHTSTNRGIHIDFENEQGNRSRNSRTTSRQQNERFSDGSTSRNARPQRESSYYNEVFSSTEAPYNSFRENTSHIRPQSAYQNSHQERDFIDSGQQASMHTFQPNVLREDVVWQPVKVIYVEKAPSEINRSGTASRQGEYSSSSYGRASRQSAPNYQQSSYSEDWGGRQRDDSYVNQAYPPAYETWNGNTNGDQRHMQAEAQWTQPLKSREGSYRQSTEVFQSRDNPTTSNWNGNYQTVNMSPQRNDYTDGVNNSRSWTSSSSSQGREYGYPTRTEHTTYSQNGTLRTGGKEGLSPRFTDQGGDSFTYRSESRNAPRLLQNTSLNGSAFGARSQGRHIAQDDELPRSSRLNFSSSSGLRRNGERSGDFQEQFTSHKSTTKAEEKEFFGKILKELENQRQNLKPEVDKLIRNSSILIDDSDLTSSMNNITLEAGKNSYIDTSLPTPVFKAYVDIKEYSPKSVTVNYDQQTNKVVVEASQVNAQGTVGKTFTQKIPLPKYADDLRLTSRMNSRGVLRIEVPLLFYFPEEQEEESKAKSFLYEATRNTTDGSQALEIVVKPGADYSLQDIQPEVINNTLIIWGGRGNKRKAIGKYVLPPTANVKNIKHRSGRDGCLTVVVPVT